MSAQTHSRFKIVERPFAAPGKCAVCGATEKPVVDFGFDLDWYGVVYFCLDCLTEVASTIGMVPHEALTVLEGEFEQTLNTYLTTNKLRLITDEQYNAIAMAFGSLCHGVTGNGSSIRVEDACIVYPEAEPSDAEPTLFDAGNDPDSEPTPKQSNHPSKRQGRPKLSASSDDGDIFSNV